MMRRRSPLGTDGFVGTIRRLAPPLDGVERATCTCWIALAREVFDGFTKEFRVDMQVFRFFGPSSRLPSNSFARITETAMWWLCCSYA